MFNKIKLLVLVVSLGFLFLGCNQKQEVKNNKIQKESIPEGHVEMYGYIVLEFEHTAIYENLISYQISKSSKGVQHGSDYHYHGATWLVLEHPSSGHSFHGRVTGRLINGTSGNRGRYSKKLVDVKIYNEKGKLINP